MNPIAQLLSEAHENRAEYTLPQLFKVFDLSDNETTLAKMKTTQDYLATWNLTIRPGLHSGEIESVRRVCFVGSVIPSIDSALDEIRGGEGEQLEFKSSLHYDHKKAKQNPGATIQELASTDVLHSCLKTIAAFLNTNGGVLYIGVDDAGVALGVEKDYACISTNPAKQNIDQWELSMRDHIKGKFLDGSLVNDFVDCKCFSIEGKQVVRAAVSVRKRLSFLRTNGTPSLFRRQGNRTEQVHIHELEEFLVSRGWKAPL